MATLLNLLILAAAVAAPTEARDPYAVEVFRCDFGTQWDVNFDRWPDGWTRRRGEGFPHFVEVNIVADRSDSERRQLEVELDGGGAAIYSPVIDIRPTFTYVLEGRIKTAGLQRTRAWLSITMLDAQRRRLDTFHSRRIGGTSDWNAIRMGPVASAHPNARYAVLGLHLEPVDGQDLTGRAWFADVWLGRLPRLALGSNASLNLHDDPDAVEIRCEITGVSDPQWRLNLSLQDWSGEVIDSDVRKLDAEPEEQIEAHSQDEAVDDPQAPESYRATVQWQPRIPRNGYYTVEIAVEGAHGNVMRRNLSLAVFEPSAPAPGPGEFGWTLPSGDHPLPLPTLAQLLGQVGIHWVKFPLWYESADEARVNDLVWFTERLRTQGIGTIGLLHNPPLSVKERFGSAASLSAAEIFTTPPEVWYPSLETVLLRLSLSVRQWQLGLDDDHSLAGLTDLERRLGELKQLLDEVGHDVQLGFGWDWLYELPGGRSPTWRFVTLSTTPAMTHHELNDYLALPTQPGVKRMVAIEPLDRRHYSIETRTADLVHRMLAAKAGGVDGIFMPQPFDDERGLMNRDGSPGALLLPWRTTASMLSGAEFLGSIELPGGSENYVFARGDEAIMVLWNERPTREVLYLGDRVEQLDLWGHRSTPATEEGRQVIEAGPLPVFVSGVNRPVAEWRMAFAFGRDRLPSVFGKMHQQTWRVQNFFPGGAGGRLRLITPSQWFVSPQTFDFELTAGEEMEQSFGVLFPFDADSGVQRVEAEFEIVADKAYRFSAYRHIGVGLGDVVVELSSQLVDGDLLVEQRLVNRSDRPVSFNCSLFAPGRRRMRTQVVRLSRGEDVSTYRIIDGAELIGETLWLRAEEIGGERSLNYHFEPTP